MPVYIPPLVKKVEIGKIPTVIGDLSDVFLTSPITGDALVYNGAGLWVNKPVVSKTEFNAYQSSVTATSGALRVEMNGLHSTDAMLQQEINEIVVASKVVFCEEFTGDGTTTSVLDGSITNGNFISGGWSVLGIANTLPSDVTDLNGSPIYDSNNYFTRHRIAITTIASDGTVTFDYAPQLGQTYKVWYFYSLTVNDRLQNYYRDDFVASMEEGASNTVLASQVLVNTASFNNILGPTDTTLQAALDTLDDHTHNILRLTTTENDTFKTIAPNGSGGVMWINPEIDINLEISGGSGILVTPVGNDYIISVKDYISKTEVSAVSGSLNGRLTTVENNYATKSAPISGKYNNVIVNSQGIVTSGGNIVYTVPSDLAPYTLLTTTAGVSAYLQSEIDTLVLNTITLSSSAGSILINKSGVNYNLEVATAPIQNHNSLNGLDGGTSGQYYHLTASQYNNYIGKPEVALVSGGLNTSITNETISRTAGDLALQTEINNITGGSFVLDSRYTTLNASATISASLANYTLLSTTTSLTGSLNSAITNETIFRTSGDLALQTEINNITGGIFVLDTRYSKTSDITVISGGLNTSINNETIFRTAYDSALQTEINNITGGSFVLDSRYTTLNAAAAISASLANYTLLSTTTSLTGSLNTAINNETIFRSAYDLALQTEINNITGGSFVLDTRYAKTSDVVTISGGLNAAITNETIFRTAGDLALQTEINNITGGNFVLDTRYSKTSDIVAISGGLNTSINNEATNRYNADLALQSEINNITGGSFVLDSRYTTLSTTASISGNLQNQIDLIVQEGTTIASSGGTILVHKNVLAFNLEVNDYISKTDVKTISGGLNTAITNETIFRVAGDLALQTEVNNITGGNFVLDTRYSKTSDIVVISGGLNNSVVNETIFRTAYDSALQTEINNITGGNFVLDTRYSKTSDITVISGGLNTSINNEAIFRVAGDLAIQTEINNITGGNFVLDTRYTKTSDIVTISGGLNTSINNEAIFRTAYDSALQTEINNITGGSFVLDTRYTKTSDIVVISGGLNTSINNEAIFRTAGDLALQTEINNITGGSFVLDSRYTTLVATASISGNLQGQINAIVQEGTTIASSGGSIIVTKNGLAFNLEVATAPIQNHNSLNGLDGGTSGQYYHLTASQYNNYIGKSEVAVVSGGLNTSITNETIFRTSYDSALQTEINNITGGSFVLDTRYSKSSDISVISGGLNTTITNETIFRTAGDLALQTEINNITGGNFVLDTRYAKTSDVVVISGGLNTAIVNETIFRTAYDTALQTEINNITGGSFALDTRYSKTSDIVTISGGLNTSINNANIFRVAGDLALQTEINNITGGNFVLDTRYSKTSDIVTISGGLNSRLTTVESNYATKASPISGTYNNVVVNSQGIVTSGGNISYALASALSSYTLLSTTASISGNLQSQIDTLVLDTISITSSGGSILVNKIGVNFNIEVAKVGLQGRVVCTNATEYTINHATVNPATDFPVVSLEVANNNSDLFIQGIYDRTATSFKVVLSGIPDSSNAILYHLNPTATLDLTPYVLKSELNTVYSISGSSILTNIQHNIIQTSTPIVTTLWSAPSNGDFINIANDTTSGENVISGNGKLIEGDYSFIIYYGESFTFRYNGTTWKAF